MDNAPVENLGEFGELHKAFHVALIAACGSPRLLDEQARIYDQAERYRHRMMTAYLLELGLGIMDEHKQLMELVLARKAAGDFAMLDHHLHHTFHTRQESC